jgi:catechol 2,3-dioxygenase-like lactoylglutathione lyase family enzyme
MIKHIDHINIVVSNLEEARQFFLHLGFVVQREGPVKGQWIEELSGLENINAYYIGLLLPDGQTNLELLHFESPDSAKDEAIGKLNQIGLRHLAFQVDDIEKTVIQLKQKNIQFLSKILTYQESKKKLCYFTGPDGIILELAEYK